MCSETPRTHVQGVRRRRRRGGSPLARARVLAAAPTPAHRPVVVPAVHPFRGPPAAAVDRDRRAAVRRGRHRGGRRAALAHARSTRGSAHDVVAAACFAHRAGRVAGAHRSLSRSRHRSRSRRRHRRRGGCRAALLHARRARGLADDVVAAALSAHRAGRVAGAHRRPGAERTVPRAGRDVRRVHALAATGAPRTLR